MKRKKPKREVGPVERALRNYKAGRMKQRVPDSVNRACGKLLARNGLIFADAIVEARRRGL